MSIFNFHLGLEPYLPTIAYIVMFGVFFAAVLWRPSISLYLMVFSLPLQTGRSKLDGYFLGSHFLDILLLATLLGLVIKGKGVLPKTKWSIFFLILAVFYYLSLWMGTFAIGAPLPIWITDRRFSDWKNYVEMFFMALLVAGTLREKRQIQILLGLMCASVLLVNRSFYTTVSVRELSHFSDEVRDAGTLGYAGVNGLAAFEAMMCSFLLGIYFYSKRAVTKIGILALGATCLYCLLFSFSRGAYAAFLAGLIVVGMLKARKVLFVALALLLGWQLLLPTAVQERISMTTTGAMPGATFEPSAQDRLVLWEDAMELFKMDPLIGSGFDTYRFKQRVGDYEDTHNYYLKVLAETGIVGFLLYLVLLGGLFRSGVALYYGSDDRFWRGIGLGFLALLVAAVVANFFGDRWTYQQLDGFVWVLLGCVIRGSLEPREEPDRVGSVKLRDPLVARPPLGTRRRFQEDIALLP